MKKTKTKTEVEQVMDDAIETINIAEEHAANVVESADAPEIRAEEITTGVVADNVAVTEEAKPANMTERFKTLTETHQKNIDLYKNNSRYSVTLDEENNRWVIKDKSSDSKRYISLEIEEENK